MSIPGMILLALYAVLACFFLLLWRTAWTGLLFYALLLCLCAWLFARQKTFLQKAPVILLLFIGLAGAILIGRPKTEPVKAYAGKQPVYTETVTLDDGDVQGVLNADKTVEIFAGIPYAAPPVGDLRWRKPQDPEPWHDVRKCDTFAPMAMQVLNPPLISSLSELIGYHDWHPTLTPTLQPVSEDCLYVNVWKPAGHVEKAPVLVYIHGGSQQTGQPWYADYSGEGLAEEGLVVVNMGYRLGVFGFLADEELMAESGTTGNYGLLDQIKALEWVRDPIAAFGGDPDNVTLAGESAGSACVSALCVSPLAKGLFVRAIGESSSLASIEPPHSFRSLEEGYASAEKLKEKYGVSSVEDLRRLDGETIVSAMDSEHHICVDGYVLERMPYESDRDGQCNQTALLHGYNKNESAAFLVFGHASKKDYRQRIERYFKDYADEVMELYPGETDEQAKENWAIIYGAVFFDYPHYCWQRAMIHNNIPVYEYLFTKENGRLGNWHSGEEVYFYGNIPERSKLYDESDRALSKQMVQAFVSFCSTGDPGFAGNTAGQVYEFGEQTGLIDEPHQDLYAILDRMYGWNLW
ncbi:MAG: carboxylesterase family protein [Solobacterium sp.]|nr:carboxylesterase family protein [Solobacterium sp.]